MLVPAVPVATCIDTNNAMVYVVVLLIVTVIAVMIPCEKKTDKWPKEP